MCTIFPKTENEPDNPLRTGDTRECTVDLTVDDDIALGQGEHEGIGARLCIHGYLFQLRLCILFVIRSFEMRNKGIKFSIAAEHKPLNPFDDIVCWMKTEEGKMYHLIQVKHGKPPVIKKIIAKDLTKTKFNNWADKFSLLRYLKGYLKVKKMAVFASSKTNFIIATNIDMDLDQIKNNNINIELCNNHTFADIMKGSDGKCYRLVLNEESGFYQELKKSSGANDEEMKMFLEDFIMAVNLPDASLLENIINTDIGRLCDFSITKAMGSELQKNLLEWMNWNKGTWLTEEIIEKLLKEVEESIVSLKLPGLDYSEVIKGMNIQLDEECLEHFKSKIVNFISPESKHHLLIVRTNPEKSVLTTIKLQQVLQSLAKDTFQFLLVRLKKQEVYLKLLKFRFTINILVIYCKVKDNLLNHQLYLCALCKTCVERNKKIILIYEEEIEMSEYVAGIQELIPLLKAAYDEDEGFSFMEMNSETQMRLFNKEAIVFQENENKISLSMLCQGDEKKMVKTTKMLIEIIDSNILVSLVKNKEIRVGNKVKNSCMLNNIYIERNLKFSEDCQRSKSGSWTKHLVDATYGYSQRIYRTSIQKNGISEERFLRGDKRVVITDDAGMGKTALLNSLIKKLKLSDQTLWICRINFINFTKILKMELKKMNQVSSNIVNYIDLFVENLMESQKDTILRTKFEKKLFRMGIEGHIKLILFFDGFDEICPKYEEIATSLLLSLQKSKVEKLFVTARCEEGQRLKNKLIGTIWKIVPLRGEQQGKFLVDYWEKALRLTDLQVSILQQLGKKTDREWQIGGASLQHPLTLVLIAEYCKEPIRKLIFEMEVKKLSTDEGIALVDEMLSNMDDIPLTKAFVKKTFAVYRSKNSKGNISSDNHFDYFISAVKRVHFHVGLIDTFGEDVAKAMTGVDLKMDEWLEVELPKIGFLQKTGDDYHFIHQTFADYFAIEFIINHPDKGRNLLETQNWTDFITNISKTRIRYIDKFIRQGWLENFKEKNCRNGEVASEVEILNFILDINFNVMYPTYLFSMLK